jgi:hypothetical protein
MKRVALIGVMAAAATWAQAQTYEPAVPAGIPDVRAPVGEPLPPQLVMTHAAGDIDARPCLQLSANAQIHRCAERYRAKANRNVRTSVKVDKSGDR